MNDGKNDAGEMIVLEYGIAGRRAQWLRERLAEGRRAELAFKIFSACTSLAALLLLVAVFGQAITALLGGQSASASQYFAIAQANITILQVAAICLSGVVLPVVAMALAQPRRLLLSARGVESVATLPFLFSAGKIGWQELQQVKLLHSVASGGTDVLLLVGANRSLRLQLAALSLDDRARLYAELNRRAPLALSDPHIAGALTTGREQAYTELWLQAFTAAPQRQSLVPLANGTVVRQRYTVRERLGVGGQGTAYLASGPDGAQVVLKEFILPVYVDAHVRRQALKAFENEARILKTLEHDNIVKLFDFFVEDQRGYLLLEYIDGPSLRQLVEKQGPLSPRRALELGEQLCEALVYLHTQSPPVVHRDVTPENLIVSSVDGRLKLVDFNVARQARDDGNTSVAGKLAYLPPEQFRGDVLPRSDIYAAGATMFFLLTGRDPEALTQSHPRQLISHLPAELDALIARATSLDAGQRIASAELMRNEIKQVASVIAS